MMYVNYQSWQHRLWNLSLAGRGYKKFTFDRRSLIENLIYFEMQQWQALKTQEISTLFSNQKGLFF